MEVSYRRPFKKFLKKQNRGLQLAIEDEATMIIETPEVGESKRGDLAGFRVHKFKFHGQEYLIAYIARDRQIVFYSIGTHENFYRELKQYLKEV